MSAPTGAVTRPLGSLAPVPAADSIGLYAAPPRREALRRREVSSVAGVPFGPDRAREPSLRGEEALDFVEGTLVASLAREGRTSPVFTAIGSGRLRRRRFVDGLEAVSLSLDEDSSVLVSRLSRGGSAHRVSNPPRGLVPGRPVRDLASLPPTEGLAAWLVASTRRTSSEDVLDPFGVAFGAPVESAVLDEVLRRAARIEGRVLAGYTSSYSVLRGVLSGGEAVTSDGDLLLGLLSAAEAGAPVEWASRRLDEREGSR